MLPPPKSNVKMASKAKPASVLLPSALQQKSSTAASNSSRPTAASAAPEVPTKRARVDKDSDDEDGDTDFFGLKRQDTDFSAQSSSQPVSAAPSIFMDDAPVGPSRPQLLEEMVCEAVHIRSSNFFRKSPIPRWRRRPRRSERVPSPTSWRVSLSTRGNSHRGERTR